MFTFHLRSSNKCWSVGRIFDAHTHSSTCAHDPRSRFVTAGVPEVVEHSDKQLLRYAVFTCTYAVRLSHMQHNAQHYIDCTRNTSEKHTDSMTRTLRTITTAHTKFTCSKVQHLWHDQPAYKTQMNRQKREIFHEFTLYKCELRSRVPITTNCRCTNDHPHNWNTKPHFTALHSAVMQRMPERNGKWSNSSILTEARFVARVLVHCLFLCLHFGPLFWGRLCVHCIVVMCSLLWASFVWISCVVLMLSDRLIVAI